MKYARCVVLLLPPYVLCLHQAFVFSLCFNWFENCAEWVVIHILSAVCLAMLEWLSYLGWILFLGYPSNSKYLSVVDVKID